MNLKLPLALLLVAGGATSALGQAAAPKPAPAPAAKPAASPAPPPSGGTLATEDDRAVYAIGLSIWRSLQQLDLTPAELEVLTRALGDAAAGKPEIKLEEYGPKIDAFGRARFQRAVEKEKARSQAYVEKQAALSGAVKGESGLIYFETLAGSGESPKASDQVKVHYRGTLVDGTEFDSSYKRNEPAQFPLGGVIRCWTEGLQKMKVGGKARLVCPPDIAYGERGRPGIPGGAALTFEVELIEIIKTEPPPPPPAPPAAAPSPAAPAPSPSPKAH